MGWPELPCCGVFCNCDEGVTQMLNWTLVQILFQVDIVQDDKTHFYTEAVQLRAHIHTHRNTHTKSDVLPGKPPLNVGNFLVRFHTHLPLFPLLSRSLPPSLSLFVSLSSTLHPHLRTEGGGPHQSRDFQRAGFSGTDVWLSCWFNICS